MKSFLSCFSFLMLFLSCLVTPVAADLLVQDTNILDAYTNPQRLISGQSTETMWLSALLGFSVEFISKDNVPQSWTYAVVKYGVGGPPNPNHWAITDDGDFNLELDDIIGLPTIGRLSHVSYFGAAPVPEPATMILLGIGLIGLAGYGRNKFRK